MKKIFLAAMTLVMAVFASCSNDDVQFDNNNELKVNFTVADKAGFDGDTRAVKTGWENGDEILIVVQSSEEVWCTSTEPFNCFKLVYNGTTWTTNTTGFDTSKLKSGYNKSFMAIYHPGTITVGDYDSYVAAYMLPGYNGGEYLQYIQTYIYDSATGIDLGEIELERYVQDFQISIEGLASAGKADGTWKLYIKDAEDNKANKMFFSAKNNAFLRDTGFGKYDDNYSTGINYGDDVVFYFSNAGCDETSLKFVLRNDEADPYTSYIYETTIIPQAGKAYILPKITDSKWTKLELI